MKTDNIDNYIFDLGGVIINLDVQRSLTALAGVSGLSPEQMIRLFKEAEEPYAYERGHISDDDFRHWLRSYSRVDLTNAQLDEAWNGMILDLPTERLELLQKLSQTHPIYLLSNTNNIHIARVNQVIDAGNQPRLEDIFHKVYYSHQMGMRKPDVEIFQHLIDTHNLNPSRTLFLDDNADNISGAKAAGLKTLHVTSPELMLTYFHEQNV